MNTPFRPQQIAIVGAGASGCLCAYFLLKAGFEVTIFDKGSPLRTLLPTGGGRCNLAHAEYDFKELAKTIPVVKNFYIQSSQNFQLTIHYLYLVNWELKHILRKTEEYFLLQTAPEMCGKKY